MGGVVGGVNAVLPAAFVQALPLPSPPEGAGETDSKVSQSGSFAAFSAPVPAASGDASGDVPFTADSARR